MVNEQLINYLKVGVSRGFKLEDLEYNLIQAGWPASAVHIAAEEIDKVQKNPIKKKSPVSNYSNQNIGSKRKIPLVVGIISILNYITAGIFLIFPLGVLFASALLGPIGILLAPYSLFIFGITVPFALLFFFTARGLRKGKRGWKIFTIILYSFSTLSLALGIFYSFNLGTLISLIIDLVLLGYLLFNKNCKEFFKKVN